MVRLNQKEDGIRILRQRAKFLSMKLHGRRHIDEETVKKLQEFIQKYGEVLKTR